MYANTYTKENREYNWRKIKENTQTTTACELMFKNVKEVFLVCDEIDICAFGIECPPMSYIHSSSLFKYFIILIA